ncbi:MAG: hypothetical protein U5Q03_16250 [Bacteroidota bacterium]|nr:hypothetical protein [Bacteroidota bacterium]
MKLYEAKNIITEVFEKWHHPRASKNCHYSSMPHIAKLTSVTPSLTTSLRSFHNSPHHTGLLS